MRRGRGVIPDARMPAPFDLRGGYRRTGGAIKPGMCPFWAEKGDVYSGGGPSPSRIRWIGGDFSISFSCSSCHIGSRGRRRRRPADALLGKDTLLRSPLGPTSRLTPPVADHPRTITMTHPILISSQDPPIQRFESPETILDSEEERQEFYVVQREKRRRRKMQKRTSESGEASGSGGAVVRGVEDDSVRFLGAKHGPRAEQFEDDEIEVIGVIPSAPVLRAPPAPPVAASSNARQGIHHKADSSADKETPSGLRANLARFKYADPPRDAPLPTSRAAAAAAIKARAALGASEPPVDGPLPAASHKKRAVTGKTRVPEMPVEPEQVRELDACVVCAMAFDRRKTAKTRWVSPFRREHGPREVC